MLKRIERGPHHIVRIGGADRFRDDVLNAQRFENRAHRTTCDDAGARRRGAQKHTARAMVTVNVMMKRTTLAQRDADQIPFRGIRRFLDRIRHLARPSVTKAYAPLLVADDNKSRKSETPAAFYHLGDAVDVNELVDELAVAILAVPFSASFAVVLEPRAYPFLCPKS